MRTTCSKRSPLQTRAISFAASAKRSLLAATREPLIAPAEAPVTIGNGDGAARSAGSSASRFSTPAW